MITVTLDDVLRLAEEKTVQTSCNGCVFAECQENAEGRLQQIGCQLKRFDKLEENGASILNVQDEAEDEDFIVIQNRVCNTCRPWDWKERLEQQGETDIAAVARKEISLKCTALIYLGPGQSIEDACITAKSMEEQNPPPAHTIIINNAGIEPAFFIKHWKLYGPKNSWGMEYITEFLEIRDEIPKKEMFFRCVDLSVRKVKTVYYSLFNAGDSVPSNYSEDIDKAMNDELIRMLALNPENDSSSGLLMQTQLHTMLGGNKERPCIDKIIAQTENQECPNLVLPLKKIVKNFNLQ